MLRYGGFLMPLFKRRIDPMSATMSLVEAIAKGDQAAVEQATKGVESLSTMDIVYSLFRFGQTFAPGIGPADKETMREALAALGGAPDMQAARVAIGLALLYKPVQATVTETVNAYGPGLNSSPSGSLGQLAVEIVVAAGQICRRLDIKFRWK
jgi:hypothetical protein